MRCDTFILPSERFSYVFIFAEKNLVSGHREPMHFKTFFHIRVAAVKSARLDHGDN